MHHIPYRKVIDIKISLQVCAKFQYSCGTSSWRSSGSNTYGTACGLAPAVGLQCSVKVDDDIETEVHESLQCSGKLAVLTFCHSFLLM